VNGYLQVIKCFRKGIEASYIGPEGGKSTAEGTDRDSINQFIVRYIISFVPKRIEEGKGREGKGRRKKRL